MPMVCPGSSPHVRGAPSMTDRMTVDTGIIPACAGSTRTVHRCRWYARDHPRMCGEHGIAIPETDVKPGSSPHVRGARNVQRVTRRE